MNKKHICLMLLMATLLIFTGCGASGSSTASNTNDANESDNSNNNDANDANDSNDSNDSISLSSCGNTQVFFTNPPADNILSIVPLGNQNPNGGHVFPTVHMYVYFADQEAGSIPTASVYAPGDVKLTRVDRMEYLNTNETDYSLSFASCTEFTSYYKHVKRLTSELLSEIGDINEGCNEYSTGGWDIRLCSKSIDVSLTAGQLIGSVGGVGQIQGNFDFGANDKRIEKLPFINQTAYYESWYHMVCAIDYYDATTKATLQSKFGYGNTFRTIAPICGATMQDIENTAQGNWFKQGTTTLEQEDDHVSLIHDNINPTLGSFAVGSNAGVDNSAISFKFSPQQSGKKNREFSQVTSDGTIYCYYNQNTSNRILLKMPTSTTLNLEKQNGDCDSPPWNFSSPIVFER